MNSVLKDSKQKNSICQLYKIGSKSAINRKKQNKWAVWTEATKSLLIQGVFKRQVDLELSLNIKSSLLVSISLNSIQCEYFLEQKPTSVLNRKIALEDLKRLFSLKTKQIQKYGQVLSLNSNILQRYEVVLRLFCIQKHRDKYPKINCWSLTIIVVNVDDWGELTAQSLIQWKNSWVKSCIILKSRAGKNTLWGKLLWQYDYDGNSVLHVYIDSGALR